MFAFTKGKSSLTSLLNLLNLYNKVIVLVDSEGGVDAVYLDLGNIFHMISHYTLIERLLI